MKVRVFTLRLGPESRVFDDGEVRAFVEAHEVLGVHEHLLHHDGEPLWAVLVTYRDRTRAGQVPRVPDPWARPAVALRCVVGRARKFASVLAPRPRRDAPHGSTRGGSWRADHGALTFQTWVSWNRIKWEVRAPVVDREAALQVPEAERALFAALRRWRNERAKRNGRPAYVLFRNAQLADIARTRPTTLAALREVHGVG